MNEQKNTDFFPEISEQDAHKVAPVIYQPYQETDEDRLHDERLNELSAQTGEVDLGELPYDAEADRKRWDELEKDFDRIFEDAARPAD